MRDALLGSELGGRLNVLKDSDFTSHMSSLMEVDDNKSEYIFSDIQFESVQRMMVDLLSFIKYNLADGNT